MPLPDAIKTHKEIWVTGAAFVTFLIAVASATIAIITYFATKAEVENLSCQMRWRIQHNTASVAWYKNQMDLLQTDQRLEQLRGQQRNGMRLTGIEAQMLKEEIDNQRTLIDQNKKWQDRMEVAKNNLVRMGAGGKCKDDF